MHYVLAGLLDLLFYPDERGNTFLRNAGKLLRGITSQKVIVPVCFLLTDCLFYSSNLDVKAVRSSETSVKFYRTAFRLIPEDSVCRLLGLFFVLEYGDRTLHRNVC
jgi:hypothetical protein